MDAPTRTDLSEGRSARAAEAIGRVACIGGALVSPRSTLRRIALTDEGGLGDVGLLLGARFLVDAAPSLARALLWLPRGEPLPAIQGVLQTLSRLLPDVVAIVLGALALALFAGRGRDAAAGRGRELDLAAYAWVPWVAVQVAAMAIHVALGRVPSATERQLAQLVGLTWSAVLWATALWVLRHPVRATMDSTNGEAK